MQSTDRHQPGFSVLQILLAIVIIGVLAGTSWVVYQHNRVMLSEAAPNTNQTSSSLTPTTSAPGQNVVKVPELGIQLMVPDSIKDLTYQMSTVTLVNGKIATLAYFSTASLAAADPGCGPSDGPLGSLEKADGQYPSSDPNAELRYGVLVKQFPTFYIAAGVPNGGGCATSTSASAAASANAAASADRVAFAATRSNIQILN